MPSLTLVFGVGLFVYLYVMKRFLKKISQFLRIMFSDHNAVSSKRVVGTAIIVNMMAVFDAVKIIGKDFTEQDVSIFWIFAIIAMSMWGFDVAKNMTKK